MNLGFNKEILRLAVPSILANITIPLVGMVDIAIAGHLELGQSASLIGGISIGAMLFDLLYWNFALLRISTGGLCAQAYGRNDVNAMAGTLIRSLIMAFLISLFVIAIQKPFLGVIFHVVPCSDTVKALAIKYFLVRVWAAPATLSLFALKGWFIGMQDSFSSMLCDLIINISNICLSYIFAIGWETSYFSLPSYDIVGIALGTLCAQYMGFITAFVIIFSKYYKKIFANYTLREIWNVFKANALLKFLHINYDLFVRSACMIAIYIGFTLISAKYGDLSLATGAIIMKLMLLFSYFTDGFAYAGEALTGKFIGRQELQNTRKTVYYTFAWSILLSVVFLFIYFAFGSQILGLISSDTEVIESAKSMFLWLLLMPVVGCAAFTWDGIYTGATASKEILWSTIYAMIAFFSVWYLGVKLFPDISGMHVLMAAYFSHLLARTIYLSIYYKKILRENFPRERI